MISRSPRVTGNTISLAESPRCRRLSAEWFTKLTPPETVLFLACVGHGLMCSQVKNFHAAASPFCPSLCLRCRWHRGWRSEFRHCCTWRELFVPADLSRHLHDYEQRRD